MDNEPVCEEEDDEGGVGLPDRLTNDVEVEEEENEEEDEEGDCVYVGCATRPRRRSLPLFFKCMIGSSIDLSSHIRSRAGISSPPPLGPYIGASLMPLESTRPLSPPAPAPVEEEEGGDDDDDDDSCDQ